MTLIRSKRDSFDQWPRTRLWGLLYVFLTLLTALIYSRMPPGSFYAPNVSREEKFFRPLREDVFIAIGHQLTAGLQGNNSQIPADLLPAPHGTAPATVLDVVVTDLSVKSPSVLTVVAFAQIKGFDGRRPEQTFPIDIDFRSPGTALPTKDAPNPDPHATIRAARGSFGATAITYGWSGSVPADGRMPGGTAELPFPREVIDQARRFIGASNGDPRSAPGNEIRMLYFSASTITTLGLGDITPLTTQARILVTVEAILGLVLIGLFLSALGSSIARQASVQAEDTAAVASPRQHGKEPSRRITTIIVTPATTT